MATNGDFPAKNTRNSKSTPDDNTEQQEDQGDKGIQTSTPKGKRRNKSPKRSPKCIDNKTKTPKTSKIPTPKSAKSDKKKPKAKSAASCKDIRGFIKFTTPNRKQTKPSTNIDADLNSTLSSISFHSVAENNSIEEADSTNTTINCVNTSHDKEVNQRYDSMENNMQESQTNKVPGAKTNSENDKNTEMPPIATSKDNYGNVKEKETKNKQCYKSARAFKS